jgi:alpha-tubulin suppressor-like RCC1 family protein
MSKSAQPPGSARFSEQSQFETKARLPRVLWQLPGAKQVVHTNEGSVCVLDRAGQVTCIGSDEFGQLGSGRLLWSTEAVDPFESKRALGSLVVPAPP